MIGPRGAIPEEFFKFIVSGLASAVERADADLLHRFMKGAYLMYGDRWRCKWSETPAFAGFNCVTDAVAVRDMKGIVTSQVNCIRLVGKKHQSFEEGRSDLIECFLTTEH